MAGDEGGGRQQRKEGEEDGEVSDERVELVCAGFAPAGERRRGSSDT